MKSSDLLFNVLSTFDFKVKIFSSKHRSHDLSPAVYAGTRLIIDHLMLNDLPFSFKFHLCFLRVLCIRQRFFVVVIPLFKWACRDTDVNLRFLSVCRCNFCFVNNASSQASSMFHQGDIHS